MKTENKTAAFYGDLVEAAMNKDVEYIARLIDTLDRGQMLLIGVALANIFNALRTMIRIKYGE